MATDTFYFQHKSLLGNTCAQIYSHKCGFAYCTPLPDAKDARVGGSLSDFIHDFGSPDHLTFYGDQVKVGRHTQFQAMLRNHHKKWHVSSPRRPNENPDEGSIRELKRRFY